jgi:hypothetical protein
MWKKHRNIFKFEKIIFLDFFHVLDLNNLSFLENVNLKLTQLIIFWAEIISFYHDKNIFNYII